MNTIQQQASPAPVPAPAQAVSTPQAQSAPVQVDPEKMRQLQMEAIKSLIGGIQKAQEKGVYTLEEAAALYQATLVFTGGVVPKAAAPAPSA